MVPLFPKSGEASVNPGSNPGRSIVLLKFPEGKFAKLTLTEKLFLISYRPASFMLLTYSYHAGFGFPCTVSNPK